MNLWRSVFIVLIGIFFLSACAHTPVKKKFTKPNVVTSAPIVTGVVLYEQALAQGGTLALTPFKAGSKAEANEELDHMAMMILKGIKESLSEEGTHFQIIEQDQGKPVLGLGGFIKEFSQSKGLMKASQDILGLEGELWLVSTGERIVSFSARKVFDPKKEKPADVAYGLGREIGGFIVRKAKSCVDSCS